MRALIFISLIIIATCIGALYGAIHDQIAYSISKEFFSVLRFSNLEINPAQASRLDVAYVGFVKTWPVGLTLGFIIALVGLLHKENKHMFKLSVQSFIFAMGIAFVFAMISIVLPIGSDETANFQNIKDIAAFLKVQRMNNYAHVGAIIGMFVGLGWQVFHFKKNNQTTL